MDGVIIISTPQEIALQDVKRGIKMFDKLKVKILGLVDNMSYFMGDDGKKYAIFGEGGVKRTSEEFEKEFIGEIPINPDVGKNGDIGIPIVEKDPNHNISKIYFKFADELKNLHIKFAWIVNSEDGLDETPYFINISGDFEYLGMPKWAIFNISSIHKVKIFKRLIDLNFSVENVFDIHYKQFASGISSPGRNFNISAFFN